MSKGSGARGVEPKPGGRGALAGDRIRVRMLFAEEGGYHSEVVSLPSQGVDEYDRLIDFLQEDEAVLKECYLDLSRLCSAHIDLGEQH